MEKITISSEVLKQMLAKAYDSGWRGCKELKESVLEQIFDDHKDDMIIKKESSDYTGPALTFTTGSTGSLGFSGSTGFSGFFGTTTVYGGNGSG